MSEERNSVAHDEGLQPWSESRVDEIMIAGMALLTVLASHSKGALACLNSLRALRQRFVFHMKQKRERIQALQTQYGERAAAARLELEVAWHCGPAGHIPEAVGAWIKEQSEGDDEDDENAELRWVLETCIGHLIQAEGSQCPLSDLYDVLKSAGSDAAMEDIRNPSKLDKLFLRQNSRPKAHESPIVRAKDGRTGNIMFAYQADWVSPDLRSIAGSS